MKKQYRTAPALTVGRLLSYLQRVVKADPERAARPVWLSVVPQLNQWDKAKHVMLRGVQGGVLLTSDTEQDLERYSKLPAKSTET
jgi:hypothetical protein